MGLYWDYTGNKLGLYWRSWGLTRAFQLVMGGTHLSLDGSCELENPIDKWMMTEGTSMTMETSAGTSYFAPLRECHYEPGYHPSPFPLPFSSHV